MKIKFNSLIYFIFTISFLFFVLSSTYALKENISFFYFAKHISIVIFCVLGIGLLSRYINKFYIRNIGIILLISIPFIFQGIIGLVVFLQYVSLVLAAIVVSKIYKKNISWIFIFLLFGIAIIPIIIDIMLNKKEFLYNDYYGRYRLLLGYFHPKEAAIGIIIPIIFFRIKFIQKLYNSIYIIFYDIVVIILLYFIQSRNMLAFYINFLLLSLLIKHIGLKYSLLVFTFIYIIVPIVMFTIYYDELNIFLSNRLFRWESANITWMGSGTSLKTSVDEFSLLSKYHIDNFYLEYLVENGVFPFIILLGSLIYFVFRIGVNKVGKTYINSLFISFLLYCFFDAGMFSTGNIFNIFIWSICFYKL